LIRKIFATDPLRKLIVSEDLPGDKVQTESELREFLHSYGSTFCHPSGTCKMGQDTMAVVDERLRVRGIDALRVVDASIMPALPSAGPAPAVFMIGEKASDLIKQDRSSGVSSLHAGAAVPSAAAARS
jgi:choline dehydrogenase